MSSDSVSFYFFDCDDNMMFLPTTILVRNTVTKEITELSTGEFADTHPVLGKPGKWQDWDLFDGSFKNFRDIPENELEPGQKQHFVKDVEKVIAGSDDSWQGPAWPMFVHACQKQRPVSIITARGHSPATLKAGVRVLVDKGLVSQEPNYHTVFPVGNPDVRRDQLDDPDLEVTTPALKKRAIMQTVEKALERYGAEPEHRFGMSDDDPKNVQLVISAMAECKKKYVDKRFFVINTHLGEQVKLEVFPMSFAATGRSGKVLS